MLTLNLNLPGRATDGWALASVSDALKSVSNEWAIEMNGELAQNTHKTAKLIANDIELAQCLIAALDGALAKYVDGGEWATGQNTVAVDAPWTPKP